MSRHRFLTGPAKFAIYARIALHVAWRYAGRARGLGWSPLDYVRFLRRALQLLLVFRHNKVVHIRDGYKLHLYLPAYPTPAFFHALDSKLVRRPPGPTTVVFSMTKSCRYRCVHCYQRTDRGADLEEPLMLRAAADMQEAGVAMFDIEGGEPFLLFPRLLHLLQALDERAETWVNTTGDGLTDEMLEPLRAARLYGVMISLHSTERDIHDKMTGRPGAFDTAVEALRRFHRLGMATAINSVLAEKEVQDGGLERLMEFARELSCDFVQLIHPKPAGRWLAKRTDMQTHPKITEHIRAQHLLYNSPARRDYPSLAAQVFEESEHVLGCTAGAVDRFYLNAHGEVQPCEFLNLSFGNVREEPFAVLLARMRDSFREPCCDWLCCTQADAICAVVQAHGIDQMPVPWSHTRDLVARWNRGPRTPVYARLGIYR